MFHRRSYRGSRFVRSSKRRFGRATAIEGLEQRYLLTIFNPLVVPIAALPVEGNALGTSSPVVATFASPNPIANLSATVVFPSGTTTATVTSTGGTETVGASNVPEYQVNYTGNWTPPDESPGVPFTVSITDSTAGTGNTTILRGATAVRDAALTGTPITGQSVTEGATVNFTGASALITFIDANPISGTSDFSATIDWGDGTPSSAGAISQPGGSGTAYVVSGTHKYLEEGQFTFTVQVLDDGGSSTSGTGSISVADAALSSGLGTAFTGTEGQTLNSVLLGTFSDGNPSASPSDFSTSIDWGDGTSGDIGEVRVLGGTLASTVFGVYGNHTYTTDSTTPFNVSIDVTDKGGSTLPTIASTATIADPLLIMAGGYKVSAAKGASTGTQPVATFVDPGGNETPADYAATIRWGDGTTSAGTISFANGFFSVSGPHTYGKTGSFVITTTITHVAGIPQSVTSSATISRAPWAPLCSTCTTFSCVKRRSAQVTVANFTADPSSATSSFTASINWGDGKTSSGTVVRDASGKYHVTATHAYAAARSSPYTVKVTIKELGGSSVSVNSTANIAGSPLVKVAGLTLAGTSNSSLNVTSTSRRRRLS